MVGFPLSCWWSGVWNVVDCGHFNLFWSFIPLFTRCCTSKVVQEFVQ